MEAQQSVGKPMGERRELESRGTAQEKLKEDSPEEGNVWAQA